MRFTLGWLRDYLEFNHSNSELCAKLTDIGLEVEKFYDPKEKMNNFVVAEVKNVKKHPNADKLSVCDVYDGKKNLQIVCGAKNVREGLFTVLAQVGAVVKPGTKDEFKIKQSSIRGEESFGMLCSEEELGITNESDGIIELDNDLEAGKSFSESFDDESIEIEIAITPNRVDCAGVFGIARDLSAAGFGTLKKKKISKGKTIFQTDLKVVNNLKDKDCPKFSLRLIKNLKNGESNKFLTRRFKHSGLKIISALVDVTNYLTIDFCRPLHVFDYDKLRGDLLIRYSKKGEHFIGLDDNEYVLEDGMMVICDQEKIVSLAGVMGTKNSGCDMDTKNVVLESAYFSPESIAKTGRKLNIQSDARYRFERGIDPNSVEDGMELASQMIVENCGGELGTIVNDDLDLKSPDPIDIDLSFIEKTLGIEVKKSFLVDTFEKLGCTISDKNQVFTVTPPTWRQDLTAPVDLVEEVGRLYGYQNIESKEIKSETNHNSKKTSDLQNVRRMLKSLLVSRNMFEIISWSFTDSKIEKVLNNNLDCVNIKNPISSELSQLRTSLICNLLSTIQKNINKNVNNFAVFELGPIFHRTDSFKQEEFVCGIRSGSLFEKNWLEKQRDVDVFDIKADLYSLLNTLDVSFDSLRISKDSKPYFHPGKCGTLMIGKDEIAFFGELHPNITKAMDIKVYCSVFELNLSKVMSFLKKKNDTRSEFRPSLYQSSIRDFSFEVKREILSVDLVNLIKKIDKNLIKDVLIFDCYEGKNIGSGLKAIAISVKIQSDNKTLEEGEINDLSNQIVSSVKEKFDAKQR